MLHSVCKKIVCIMYVYIYIVVANRYFIWYLTDLYIHSYFTSLTLSKEGSVERK